VYGYLEQIHLVTQHKGPHFFKLLKKHDKF
jgi:hypothetical protein